jgi:hypothetical protein
MIDQQIHVRVGPVLSAGGRAEEDGKADAGLGP